MLAGLSLLAFAGVAAAAIEPHELASHAQSQPIFNFKRDIEDRDTAPCKILSQAYKAAGAKLGDAPTVDVPPSVGIACLKSVPLAKERDLALLEYLEPFISFQSTIEVLANPPQEYLYESLDVLGGFDAIKSKLQKDGYKNQYEFMTDVRSIFAASNDGHFNYPPALLNTLQFTRKELDLISISADGLALPQIFFTIDVNRGNQGLLDYRPSAVASIDGTPISKWLQNDAVYSVGKAQDPDAQYNGEFWTLQRRAAGSNGKATYTNFEVPDTYNVKFRNGTYLTVKNYITIYPTADFTDIQTGEDLQNAIEIPSTKSKRDAQNLVPRAASSKNTTKTFTGYPTPEFMHTQGNLAGYFLDGDYKDTAVLSVLSFLPLSTKAQASLNYTDFVLEARALVADFFAKAQKQNRDKLVIDMTNNGGGSVVLANELYRLIFPEGKFSTWDRYRANEVLEVTAAADYDTLVNVLVTQSKWYPIDYKGQAIKTGEAWFGPYQAGKQNVTQAFSDNKNVSMSDLGPFYYNGEKPEYSVIKKAVFKPENVVVITDGICASACTIFTGLITRNQGVRTLALGGRPLNLAMQAMGGVKGTRLLKNSAIVSATASYVTAVKDKKEVISILQAHEDILPSIEDPPLLPLSDGSVNSLNGYTESDINGYPVHFKYEAANCRLFYTQAMTKYVSAQWQAAYDVAWKGAKCVTGSTSSQDGTMGKETLKYDSRVRSQVAGIKSPGSK